MKYQFCIRFKDIDANSASSKAILDCNEIFSKHGYKDYTITVRDNTDKKKYYFLLLKEMIKFYWGLKRNSIIGIQYPLLSINNVFNFYIKLAKLKGARFFCIVHDVESLRSGGKDAALIEAEVKNLNYYDTIIAHNEAMLVWLRQAGVTKHIIPLMLFDYLSDDFVVKSHSLQQPIVYAGNLNKSTFIYDMPKIKRQLNLYGPGFKFIDTGSPLLHWCGQFEPNEVQKQLVGSFGLIWDGSSIEKCDEILGNYLYYNNPHKCSLYIAAGLPLIAPANSAIGKFIGQMNIGFVVSDLYELEHIKIDPQIYSAMKANVMNVRTKIIKGEYFSTAITISEQYVTANN